MSVEITPKGTRGTSFPKVPGWLMRGVLGIFIGVLQLSGGRMKMGGVPLLVLTTVGAKSGKIRRVPLTWFRDEPDRPDRWLIVASLGGAPNHPNWFHNLARNPDRVWIEVRRRRLKVTPETLKGAEREEAWRRIVAAYAGYGGYATKTDRLIPVVRLMALNIEEGTR
jgi:deazaflavin-dependent oxidoreductase (nitroreductase family)